MTLDMYPCTNYLFDSLIFICIWFVMSWGCPHHDKVSQPYLLKPDRRTLWRNDKREPVNKTNIKI